VLVPIERPAVTALCRLLGALAAIASPAATRPNGALAKSRRSIVGADAGRQIVALTIKSTYVAYLFMRRPRRPSPQLRTLLEALVARMPMWCHGYELMKETGLLSGTVYPLLMRMTDQGLVEAEWRAPEQPGRPPRHAYRLTAAGVRLAQEYAGKPEAPGGMPVPA
jgi:hypothetical protein